MGLFDLPAPLLDAVDGVAGVVLPDGLRLLLWGVLAGWLTMVVYRRLSNQEKIGALKAEQKVQQKAISAFDGEFDELLPMILATLKLGMRQLGLSLGPALLATLPVLFVVAWVAGQFSYRLPEPGAAVEVTIEPATSEAGWLPPQAESAQGWTIQWPAVGKTATLSEAGKELLTLPLQHSVPVIHKKQWWNFLIGNPIGYLPKDVGTEAVHLALPEQQYLGFGPGWLRGWMFLFFSCFLLASVAFKFILRID